MKKCENCKVMLYDSQHICPLCYEKVGAQGQAVVQYPTYEHIMQQKRALKNLPLFVAVSVTIICIFINIFTHRAGENIWSIIVSASMMYGLSMYYVIIRPARHGKRVFYSYVFLGAFFIVIDLASGMRFWSTDYAFPFLTVGTVLYLTILAVQSKQLFSEYFGYILAVTMVSFSSVIIYLLGWHNSAWGALVAIVFSVIIAFGLYLFADKTLKQELRKRFNRH